VITGSRPVACAPKGVGGREFEPHALAGTSPSMRLRFVAAKGARGILPAQVRDWQEPFAPSFSRAEGSSLASVVSRIAPGPPELVPLKSMVGPIRNRSYPSSLRIPFPLLHRWAL